MASTSALAERTNSYLSTFDSHSFKAFEFRDNVLPKHLQNQTQHQQTENYSRYNDVTGQSDSGLIMDFEDRDRAREDLVAFKDFVSTLKFAYLESNMKINFAGHISHSEGCRTVSTEENDALEKKRLQTKAELRERKARAAEIEGLVRAEAELLEQKHQKVQDDRDRAFTLLKEIKEMEYQVALLKSKRDTPDARITISEANNLLEEQDLKMATFGPDIKAFEKKKKEASHNIKLHKSQIENLMRMKGQLEKEAKDNAGERDEKVHDGCRWITNATELYQSLLGIKAAYAIGAPPTEMVIEYQHPEGEQDDIRKLSIELSPEGKMTGAKLVDSAEDIQDIVDAYLENQDMQSLVQEVRVRIGR